MHLLFQDCHLIPASKPPVSQSTAILRLPDSG
jgi:hypothetical protein